MADAHNAYQFKQLVKDNLKNTFRFFGESDHGATIIACSIAVFKGIFRPLFTMMDKKSDPESKKYAAVREGLTEVAALPLYAVTPWIAGKLVDKFISHDTDKFAKKRIKTNSKFFAICAATLIIPAVCNAIQPPIMAAYKRKQEAKKTQIAQDVPKTTTLNKPSFTSNSLPVKNLHKANYGMRVGN